jgi:hypothetical protein
VEEKVPNAGIFWDLSSVLACMSPKRQKGKEKADKIIPAKRIQSTQLDNNLMAVMTHEPPDAFYAKKVGGECGDPENWLAHATKSGSQDLSPEKQSSQKRSRSFVQVWRDPCPKGPIIRD